MKWGSNINLKLSDLFIYRKQIKTCGVIKLPKYFEYKRQLDNLWSKNLHSLDDSSILAINVVQEDQLDVAKDFTIRYWWYLHYESTERSHKKSHHGPNRNFSSIFIFLCKAVQTKDWHVKNVFELSTTKVSTIR